MTIAVPVTTPNGDVTVHLYITAARGEVKPLEVTFSDMRERGKIFLSDWTEHQRQQTLFYLFFISLPAMKNTTDMSQFVWPKSVSPEQVWIHSRTTTNQQTTNNKPTNNQQQTNPQPTNNKQNKPTTTNKQPNRPTNTKHHHSVKLENVEN